MSPLAASCSAAGSAAASIANASPLPGDRRSGGTSAGGERQSKTKPELLQGPPPRCHGNGVAGAGAKWRRILGNLSEQAATGEKVGSRRLAWSWQEGRRGYGASPGCASPV